MSPYNSHKAVEVCAGKQCGKVGVQFAQEDVAKAIAKMFNANGPGVWDFCLANRDNRSCIQNDITYTVNGLVTGHVPQAALRAGAQYDGKKGVRFRVNIPTISLGTSAVCDDAHSTLSVRSPNNILWLSNPYKCSFGGGPKNITAEGRYGIDFIDFDRAIMGGEFTIRVSGGSSGYSTGYAVTRLSIGMAEAQEVWLHRKRARPKAVAATTIRRNVQPTPVIQKVATLPAPPVGSQISDPYSGLQFGKYYALVIGNNAYSHLTKLKTAVNDAASVAKVLKREYGFTVNLLKDATRGKILRAFAELRARLKFDDNLLVYYAGHGLLDEIGQQGYWLPVDAEEGIPTNWISTGDITVMLRAIRAKHVMVVADSCYSGTLVRSSIAAPKTAKERRTWVEKMLTKRSRVALVSGGLEPVVDSGGEGEHSVFATAFINALRDNHTVMEGQALFDRIKRPVVLNSDQTPQYSDIRRAGHGGGEFLFVRLRTH